MTASIPKKQIFPFWEEAIFCNMTIVVEVPGHGFNPIKKARSK
jgi:hypothetical protein